MRGSKGIELARNDRVNVAIQHLIVELELLHVEATHVEPFNPDCMFQGGKTVEDGEAIGGVSDESITETNKLILQLLEWQPCFFSASLQNYYLKCSH